MCVFVWPLPRGKRTQKWAIRRVEEMEIYNKKDERTVQKANGCVGWAEREPSWISIQLSAAQANLCPLFCCFSLPHGSTWHVTGVVSIKPLFHPQTYVEKAKKNPKSNSSKRKKNNMEVINKYNTHYSDWREKKSLIMLPLSFPTLPTYCMTLNHHSVRWTFAKEPKKSSQW